MGFLQKLGEFYHPIKTKQKHLHLLKKNNKGTNQKKINKHTPKPKQTKMRKEDRNQTPGIL